MVDIIPDQIWMVVVGFIVAFILAFGIGANDVANSFGTSVGAKVLSLKQACFLATICESLGAVLLGAKVSTTIRKGIVNIDLFGARNNGTALLMAGHVAALIGSCFWLLVATFFRLPVSGTHSIVGATVGFSLVVFGLDAIKWVGLGKIVASWFLSPLLSGIMSVAMFYTLRTLVLKKNIEKDPMEPVLRIIPAFYGTVVLVNSFSILYSGPPMLYFDRIPLYGVFILSCACACIALVVVKLWLVPYSRRKIIAGKSTKPQWVSKFSAQWSRIKGLRSRKSKGPDADQPVSLELNEGTENEAQLPEITVAESATTTSRSAESRGQEVHPNGDKPASFKPAFTTAYFSATHTDPPPVYTVETPLHNAALFPARPLGPQQATSRVFQVEPSVNGKKPSDASPTSAPDNPEGYHTNLPKPAVATLPPIGEEPELRGTLSDRPSEVAVFSLLQVLTAVFGSFAHGGNDVSNAIGPFVGLWIAATTHSVDSQKETPIWILIYGGFGISVGLWLWGRRVIQTLGEDLTKITPSSGVCIEVGAALTVLVASKAGLPISTTHCKVGSIVGVGRARSRDNVDWKLFRNIFIAWVVTLPAAGAISAAVMYAFTFLV